MSSSLGRHILVEFFECSPEILNDVIVIEQSMVAAAKEAQATVINSTFHHFSPFGVSGVVVIQESHLAIHTWPEFRYAAVDIFTCGTSVNPWISYDYLKKAFEAEHGSALEINRGQIDLLERISIDSLKKERQNHEIENNYDQAYAPSENIPKPTFKRDIWFTDKDENRALSIRYDEVLYRQKSAYQLVQVLNTYAYGKMLTIDGMVMCTERDEFVYHELITHTAMQLKSDIKKVLVIGGGDGGTVRELMRYEDQLEQVVMVEIDEKVVEASRQFLPTMSCQLSHPKLDLRIEDGIAFLENAAAESFDLIIIDGSDPEGPAEGLFSKSFYENVYRCLTSDGVLTLQSESPHFNGKAFAELHHCLQDVFGGDKVHCYLGFIPTYPTGMWAFNFASKGDIHPTANLDDSKAEAFSQAQELKYYSAEMQRAAFTLPPFVKQMLRR
jgi:spermidine synthase